eukprot:357308-Chlamydomonas_euryale.AAC.16
MLSSHRPRLLPPHFLFCPLASTRAAPVALVIGVGESALNGQPAATGQRSAWGGIRAGHAAADPVCAGVSEARSDGRGVGVGGHAGGRLHI